LSDISWSEEDKEKMEVLALLHDVIYDPREKDNEEISIKFVKKIFGARTQIEEILDGIRYTKYDKEHDFDKLDSDSFIKMFCIFDVGPSYYEEYNLSGSVRMEKGAISNLINREKLLLKEFQFVDYPTYKNKRMEFVENFKYFNDAKKTMDLLANYRPKIGVYPGSFNPFHIGHLNILEQAEKVFDKVIIAIGKNPDKSAETEKDLIAVRKILPFHEVVSYDGLLSDYLKSIDYADVSVIRGLRSGYDLDYEVNQLRILEDCGCSLPVIYFMCSQNTSHISSSMIRGISKIAPLEAAKYLPKKYSYANKESK
jgi:pantetheine-phosphate adenylyltransferase